MAPAHARIADYAVAIGRVGLLLIVTLAMALSLTGPAEAHFSPRKAIWGPATVNGVSQFPIYRDLGVGIYETSVNWSSVAPTRPRRARDPFDPAYQWPADVTDAVAQARRYRMRVTLMIVGAPPWANGGHPSNWAPRRPSDYADFAVAAARRYPSVHLWLVWGEPSRVHSFAPMTPSRPGALHLTTRQAAAPRLYARILDATYGALKGLSRHNLIIGGNTYTTGDIRTRQWINYMRLPGGKPPRLDLYGHNPFSFRPPNLANPPGALATVDFSDLERLSTIVDRNLTGSRRWHIPLFLSEWTIPTGPDDEFNFYTDLGVQADWIRAAFRIVRRWPRIYALGWIHIRDDPPGGSMGGLLDAQGQKKPGYYAFQAGSTAHASMPADTTSGIHLAQPFNYHEPIVNGMVQGEAGVVDYVWGATGNPGDVPGGGSWHETYEPWGRDVHGYTLSWLQANHPTWVMYLSDRRTAATAFGNPIPFLDTTNPDVQRWIVSHEVTLLKVLSGYQGVSWDNGVVYNLSGAAGHFDTAHHWVQQYSGAYSETDYANAQTAAFAAVTSAIKAARPDTSATLNQSFVCDSLWSAPLASTDMVMDEGGFTNGGNAAHPYVTTAAGNGCDNQWLSRVQTEVHLQKDLGKGLVLLNEEPYTVSSHMTDRSSQARFDLQWALANYLLVKYAHSYFWFGGAQHYGGGPILQREYAAPVGSPYDDFRAVGGVYVRDFTNGLALVNPNPTLMMTVTLPTGLYRDLYGVSTDQVLMPPHSGLVLLGQTPNSGAAVSSSAPTGSDGAASPVPSAPPAPRHLRGRLHWSIAAFQAGRSSLLETPGQSRASRSACRAVLPEPVRVLALMRERHMTRTEGSSATAGRFNGHRLPSCGTPRCCFRPRRAGTQRIGLVVLDNANQTAGAIRLLRVSQSRRASHSQ